MNTTMSARTDPSATNFLRSALLRYAKLACPVAKKTGGSRSGQTRDGAKLKGKDYDKGRPT